MAEAIVSTLKAKIKANDEELQMFQDKWEISHHHTAIDSIVHITDVSEYKLEIIKNQQNKKIIKIIRCEDTRTQLNTEIKEREESEAEVGKSFLYFSLKLFSYYLTNYLFATCCTNVEKGQVRSVSAELEKILLNFSSCNYQLPQ